jgi:hypothetical protein
MAQRAGYGNKLPFLAGEKIIKWQHKSFEVDINSDIYAINIYQLSLYDYTSLVALTPFNQVYYARNNENHIDINYRNKNWFIRGVLEGVDSDGDGFDDYLEFCNGTDYLDPASKLSVKLNSIQSLADGRKRIYWNKTPNTNYKVFFCEKLGNEWQEIKDVFYYSSSLSTEYYSYLSSTNNSGFFKVVAEPHDPAY